MMRIGVIGHRGYEGLPEILALLASEAPRLGLELRYEAGLLPVRARRRVARRRRPASTRCSRSAATARCCAPRASSTAPTCRSWA